MSRRVKIEEDSADRGGYNIIFCESPGMFETTHRLYVGDLDAAVIRRINMFMCYNSEWDMYDLPPIVKNVKEED